MVRAGGKKESPNGDRMSEGSKVAVAASSGKSLAGTGVQLDVGDNKMHWLKGAANGGDAAAEGTYVQVCKIWRNSTIST
jgi:hypothetical protein